MTDAEIRAAHPEQVAAEVAKQPKPADPPAPTPPAPSDEGRDAAMARERRAREDAEKRAKDAEEKVAEAERKKAEEEGKWKELAEEETRKREALEASNRVKEQQRLAERSAGDLKFKDTGYALYLLQQDKVELNDPAAVKAALTELAQTRKELITGTAPAPSGGPAGGADGKPAGLTREQLSAMTPKQIAALDPKIVNEALAS